MYLSDEFIMEKLNSILEHKMAKEIFTPLLQKKGLKGVKFTGGSDEEGIDIEYYEKSNADNTKQYAGIQFKKGDITYSSRAANGTVKDLKNQAEEAFAKDICDVNSGGVNHISRFIVATTGEINENARKMINKAKNRGEQTNISYWDCSKLANDIRNYFLDEFIDYFNIDEDEETEEYDYVENIVTLDYIEENYRDLIIKSNKCVKTFTSIQKEIVKAIINNYFESNFCEISIGDLLYELETQEEYIKNDLIDLQRFGNVYIEDDTVSLDGKANNLIRLAESIVEEMVSADEYEENEDEAERIFYDLIDEI